uniref:Putative secreted peptide n=1 Tax=Anopheles braziliensis TaxID=58242 RepID=A0A2M3ZXF4_9DIPT
MLLLLVARIERVVLLLVEIVIPFLAVSVPLVVRERKVRIGSVPFAHLTALSPVGGGGGSITIVLVTVASGMLLLRIR